MSDFAMAKKDSPLCGCGGPAPGLFWDDSKKTLVPRSWCPKHETQIMWNCMEAWNYVNLFTTAFAALPAFYLLIFHTAEFVWQKGSPQDRSKLKDDGFFPATANSRRMTLRIDKGLGNRDFNRNWKTGILNGSNYLRSPSHFIKKTK